MGRFIGVDLHKNMFVVSFYEAEEKKHRMESFKLANISAFTKQLRKTDLVGVEATGNTRYFVNQISEYVQEVKVVNPVQFKVISHSVKRLTNRTPKSSPSF